MRSARPGQGREWLLLGLVRRREAPLHSLWTRPLFCSPCSTRLPLLFLTAGQAFFSVTLHPNQTDSLYSRSALSITLWISATSCVLSVYVHMCWTQEPVPADIPRRSSTSTNLTGHEKIICLKCCLLALPCRTLHLTRGKFQSCTLTLWSISNLWSHVSRRFSCL